MAACSFNACPNMVGRIKLYPWLLSFTMLLFVLVIPCGELSPLS